MTLAPARRRRLQTMTSNPLLGSGTVFATKPPVQIPNAALQRPRSLLAGPSNSLFGTHCLRISTTHPSRSPIPPRRHPHRDATITTVAVQELRPSGADLTRPRNGARSAPTLVISSSSSTAKNKIPRPDRRARTAQQQQRGTLATVARARALAPARHLQRPSTPPL